MKNKLLPVLFLFASPAFAQIDLTSGGTGSVTGVPQSFNETRGIDVTVVSANNVALTKMDLHGFYVGGDGMAHVGARIYNSSTNALVYSHDTTVYNINNGSVNMPAPYVLVAGSSYRICFYCSGINSDNSGYMWQPNSFPYTETHHLLQINGAWESASDVFPPNVNIFVPLVSLEYDSTFTTGMATAGFSSSANVFPNPFAAQLNLIIDNSNNCESTFILYDANAQKVMEQNFTNSTTVNAEQLDKGMYFYELKNKNGMIKKGKLIKN